MSYLGGATSGQFTRLHPHTFSIKVCLQVSPSVYNFLLSELSITSLPKLLQEYLPLTFVVLILELEVPETWVFIVEVDYCVLFIVVPIWLRTVDGRPQKLQLGEKLPQGVVLLPSWFAQSLGNFFNLPEHAGSNAFPRCY